MSLVQARPARVRSLALKRALTNLVGNAVAYGGGALVSLVPPKDGSLRLTIEDDGPGIPEDALQSVLEPFVRLDTARRRDTLGLGLGLAIVVRLVDLEGGTLGLSNLPEGGLRAEIRLPR